MHDGPPPRSIPAACLVVLGAVLLGVAYAQPTVTYRAAFAAPEVYSIYGGIEVLWQDGSHVLSAIVFLFSIVFPIAKLVVLALLLLDKLPRRVRGRTVEWVGLMGKWSMLDVFVIAGFVGSMRLGVVASGTSRVGIHLFSAAIVVSMLAAAVVARLERGGPRPVGEHELPRGAVRTSVSFLALGLLATAIVFPLFEVQALMGMVKNEVGLAATTRRLFVDDEIGLGAALALWVVGLCAARALLSAWLRWRPRTPAGLRRATLALDEWGMVDVFALALAIVWIKLNELASTDAGPGFAATFLAAGATQLDAWLLRRDLRPGRATSPPA